MAGGKDTREATDRPRKVFRRPKRTPAEDMWHTLAVGIPIGIALFFAIEIIVKVSA